MQGKFALSRQPKQTRKQNASLVAANANCVSDQDETGTMMTIMTIAGELTQVETARIVRSFVRSIELFHVYCPRKNTFLARALARPQRLAKGVVL